MDFVEIKKQFDAIKLNIAQEELNEIEQGEIYFQKLIDIMLIREVLSIDFFVDSYSDKKNPYIMCGQERIPYNPVRKYYFSNKNSVQDFFKLYVHSSSEAISEITLEWKGE